MAFRATVHLPRLVFQAHRRQCEAAAAHAGPRMLLQSSHAAAYSYPNEFN
eukprot:COSAG06_NODE_4897_length_3875_cov_4.224047_6_plen_50_part_00